jgi:adenosylmethionine-8-amino-7-oxononanoate aminotransferase
LCDRYGLLLIADEIAVGFGRTGSMFACERARIAPDIMTVGKAMTGGCLPMSAALVSDAVYDAFRETPDRDRTFYHSHTFGGNPIACAAALAALDAYRDESVIERSQPRIRQLAHGMRELGDLLGGSKWRALGMIGVVEVDDANGGAGRARRIARRALELGLFIRPLHRAVYLWPPLTTSADELEEMLSILKTSVAQTV